MDSAPIRSVPRWLHVWAILTVAATAVLLALGSLVTTFRVGMADPVWPTTPWFLFFASWTEPKPGFIIEHAHRLAGYVIGCLTIVLAAGMWVQAKSCGLKKLGIYCLFAVIFQGLLGGFRVVLNELIGLDLAVIHGIFAQLVFSLLIGAAILSAAPSTKPAFAETDRLRIHRAAHLLAGIVFLQLIWGALIRHNPTPLVQRMHLTTAFAVAAAAVWAIKSARGSPVTWSRLRRASVVLSVFLALQILLGVEAWMGKFASGVLPELQVITRSLAVVRTAHVLIGTGILATSIAFLLLTRDTRIVCEVSIAHTQHNPPTNPVPVLAGSHQLGGAS